VTDNKTKYFNKNSHKYFIILTLALSILINLHVIFQFKMQTILNHMGSLDFSVEYNIVVFSLTDYNYTHDLTKEQLGLLEFLNIFKIIISDFILVFIGIYIDFKLYLFIKNKPRIATNYSLNNFLQIIKKKRKEVESHKRISSMIILNGCNTFLLRLPYSIFALHGFIIRYDLESQKFFPNHYWYSICRQGQFCNSLVSICFFLYLLSFIFQFFIFFKLDKNFKESFNDFYEKFKKKFNFKINRRTVIVV